MHDLQRQSAHHKDLLPTASINRTRELPVVVGCNGSTGAGQHFLTLTVRIERQVWRNL